MNTSTPEEMIDLFFKTYQSNKPSEAVDELYSHNPWMERVKDDVAKLKTQFIDLKTFLGEYNGHELIYKKTVKECFMLAAYLVKYDRQPMRMNFEFYKPKDTWFLHSFSFDDNFSDDLKNALQSEILKTLK